MDIEFHYYITYLTAKKAGFTAEESQIIAYSSQYVDDNDLIFSIANGQYQNFISQTINILKPWKKLLRIYPLFHFIPGALDLNTVHRRDGKLHYLNTTPCSQNAKDILRKAFSSRDLYRIGIASHAFTDTWAHQNFVGYFDSFNSMKNIFHIYFPFIGHSRAGFKPDRISIKWNDNRLVKGLSIRDNDTIFLEAVSCLFDEYCSCLKTEFKRDIIMEEKNSLLKDVKDTINSNKNRKARISNYIFLTGTKGYGNIPLKPYCQDDWMDEAVNENIKGFRIRSRRAIARFLKSRIAMKIKPLRDKYSWKDGNEYQNTHWYKFQEAVKSHQKEAFNILKDRLSKMEIDYKMW